MDEPTDPLARQMALTALTTEHFNLQTARIGTISEANGRSSLYLGDVVECDDRDRLHRPGEPAR